ncbi:MAG: helix-turn-helix domain-containing protein, partial [Propionibacteriaceae bacterium]|nr:helix-turn-helix domain-containing protein [Propionibacteriaceae bacterium]
MSAQDTAGFGVVPRYLRGRLTPQEMAVYVVLSWRANEAGECWPSLATLAADACCSKSTVQRALEGLREKKAVRWERRTAGDGALTSSVYRLAIWRDPQVIGTTPNGQKDHTLWSERPDPIVDMTIPYSRFDHVTRTIEREPLNDKQSPSTAAPLTTRDATIEPVSPPMSTEPIQPGNE